MRPFFFLESLMRRQTIVSTVLYAVIAVIAIAAYAPGLHGSFLFDDFANLPTLGATGPVDNAASFWRYITSGTADPTGRPLALLSFLLDARDWPADPFFFKRTNLVLHLVNSLLLFLLLRRLGRALTVNRQSSACARADMAAALGTALWLLHPLFVSTTLYVVQREAMLPATFVLIGLLAWLHGRTKYAEGRSIAGALWCIAGLGGSTLLATLSKANGALLPLLAWLIEWVLLGPLHTQPDTLGKDARRSANRYGLIQLFFLWLPSAAIVCWLLLQGLPDILAGQTHGRPWTMGQRMLTEPRVITDYLRLLWIPHPYTSGLFNDQLLASHSLFDPPSTLYAAAFVLALLALGFGLRRRWPAVSLALLFFFGGHLVESTVLPLELYFEHRNYMPAMLLFWPLSLWICAVPQASTEQLLVRPMRVLPRTALAATLIAVLAMMTHARSDLWGNTREQALLWVRINPSSPRAQANAAQALIASGHPDLAIPPLRRGLSRSPGEIQLAMNLFGAECQLGSVTATTFAATEQALRSTTDPGTLLSHWFDRAIDGAAHPTCPQADFSHIELLLEAADENQRLMASPGRRQDVAYLQGRLALSRGQAKQALTYFDKALDRQVRVEAAMRQAAILGSAGYPELGLAHLSHYDALQASATKAGDAYRPPFGMPRIHAWVLRRQGYWDGELSRLRATLREDARSKEVKSE
ncbi:MAG TPA: tetratricopeptide repeat protein [Frateuria sp.]|uniref:tetratricopeptide repeat protein n=1 Tax=Frateuria sp. TaxID=2211372 RepID=UPI002DF03871|nr:tetratricopeptide repeat protein [Frateuria sp.]